MDIYVSFPLTAFIFSDLNYKIVIFLSQTDSTPKLFLRKKKHCIKTFSCGEDWMFLLVYYV
jgi:hypothetical protein